ncbi:CoA transferase [Arthrobacter sp. A5]|uniref:CoA transferase n=1 Tax=Arthrobacter sp. A5 TaxID=576926 RepID=UPI003DA83149
MTAEQLLQRIWQGLGGAADGDDGVLFHGSRTLPSAFAVTDLAAASVAAAGAAVAGLVETFGVPRPQVRVDRGLASLWFGQSFRPVGWELPSAWDSLAGDYRTLDGWIRLHTNAPHHRAAALSVLGMAAPPEPSGARAVPEPAHPGAGPSRATVAAAVEHWRAADLEHAVLAAGGCAAQMRSVADWAMHPQGAAVIAEPLIHWDRLGRAALRDAGTPERPLDGVKVLDLTRVLAGPVTTRFLAGYGAQVLRIDPLDWFEPALEPEMTVGKNCARLDLKKPDGLLRFKTLLAEADILVHGYRPGALNRLGLGPSVLATDYPGLVTAALDAYGWTGPWAGRRGFDSLVQMSCGIADAGMRNYGSPAPRPLPVQALDHATGYLLAAATVLAWTRRRGGEVTAVRASLARTAVELVGTSEGIGAVGLMGTGPSDVPSAADQAAAPEQTVWGAGLRLPMPMEVAGVPVRWDVPARGYGSAPPRW